jgi:membrane fusion protein (multidrug efflux system)
MEPKQRVILTDNALVMNIGLTSKLTQLVVLVSFALFSGITACSTETQSKENEGKEDSTTVVPVEAVNVSSADMAAYYASTTTLEAENQARVVAKVAGIIEQIHVEEGDFVEAGQPLAQLEDEQYRLELNRAKALLKQRENEYKRKKELYERNVISAEDFENAKYSYEDQKASYELAKLNVEHTTIKAPIDGIISERSIKSGNMLSNNEETFTITDMDPLLAVLHAPEHEMSKLKVGQKALLKADALPAQTFQGEILRLSPTVDPSTGTFKVTVAVRDETYQLKPGMFGRIRIMYDLHPNALQIPKSAVISEDDSEHVFVVRDQQAFRKAIQTGYSEENMVEVLDGLGPDEMVVTIGHNSLQDSSLVEIIE